MAFTPASWLYIGGVLFFCSSVQSTVGFAFSLFGLPLLLLLGLPLPETVALTTIASVLQRIFTVYSLRAHVNWRELLPMITIAALSLPLGTWLLRLLSTQSRTTAQQVIGGIIMLALLVQAVIRVAPRSRVPAGWGYLASMLSGILNGFGNIGGPPLVLWMHAHAWPNEKLRVTALAITLPLVPFQLVLLVLTFGGSVAKSIPVALTLLPLVFAGGMLGLWVGKKIHVPVLRTLAYLLLGLIAAYAMLKPYLRF